jgi:hypothetical protein
MAARQPSSVLPFLRRLAAPAGGTDADLLCRFVGQRDEAAFTALVLRHGPMVYGVCQRVLRNAHDAEDVKEESQRGEIEKEQARLQQAVEAAGKNRKLERLAVRVAKGADLTFSSRHLPSVGNSVQRSLADLAKRKWLYASVDLVVEDDQLVVKKVVVWW